MGSAVGIVRQNSGILFVLEHTGCPYIHSIELMIAWIAGLELCGAEVNAIEKFQEFECLIESGLLRQFGA